METEKSRDCLFFAEDSVVLKSTKSTRCGVVVQSYADWLDGDFSDSDDELVISKPGTAKVAFYPSGQESEIHERKVRFYCILIFSFCVYYLDLILIVMHNKLLQQIVSSFRQSF